jgi:hypothetical protein
MLLGQYTKVKLNKLEIGAKWFGEYAQWDSDKTAKTGFVGFGSTYPGALGFFGLSSYRFCGVAFIEQVFFFGQS